MKKQIIAIVILAVLTLVFLNINLKTTANVIQEETIIIPVKAHLISDFSNQYTTRKKEANVLQVLEDANKIWEQANIHFQLQSVQEDQVSFDAIPNAVNGNHIELYNTESFNPNEVNIFFTNKLSGLNGLTLVRINSVLISDRTNVSPPRVLAHELGHILNLIHQEDKNNLMSQGEEGQDLSQAQIEAARTTANELFHK